MQAVVQLRSEINVDEDVCDTLEMLNVHAINHCALVPETDTYRGMLTKVANVAAFGEPSPDVLATLLRGRAEPATGDGDVDDEWVAEHTAYDDIDALAAALVAEETTLRDAGLAPALRLHPPRGGHDGIKHGASTGGELGPQDTASIDQLLEAMR